MRAGAPPAQSPSASGVQLCASTSAPRSASRPCASSTSSAPCASWLRTLYSDFQDAETRQRSVFAFEDGTLAGVEDGVYRIDELPADALARRVRWRTKEQSTLALNAGGENRLDGATLDYHIGYTDTRERVPVLGHGVGSRAVGQVGFADIGASVMAHLGLPAPEHGRSFL